MYIARYLNQTKHPDAIKLLALRHVLSPTPASAGGGWVQSNHITSKILRGTQKGIRVWRCHHRACRELLRPRTRRHFVPNLIWSLITFLCLFPGKGKTSCLIIDTDYLLVHLIYEYAISHKLEEQIHRGEGASSKLASGRHPNALSRRSVGKTEVDASEEERKANSHLLFTCSHAKNSQHLREAA